MKTHTKQDLAFVMGEYRLICVCGDDFYSKSKAEVYDLWEDHINEHENDCSG